MQQPTATSHRCILPLYPTLYPTAVFYHRFLPLYPTAASYSCILPSHPTAISCRRILPLYPAVASYLYILPSHPTAIFCRHILLLYPAVASYRYILPSHPTAIILPSHPTAAKIRGRRRGRAGPEGEGNRKTMFRGAVRRSTCPRHLVKSPLAMNLVTGSRLASDQRSASFSGSPPPPVLLCPSSFPVPFSHPSTTYQHYPPQIAAAHQTPLSHPPPQAQKHKYY